MYDEFEVLAAKRQIEKIFGGDYFSICSLGELATLLGVQLNKKIYTQLRSYHCILFTDMTDQEKKLLQQKVIECLEGEKMFDISMILEALTGSTIQPNINESSALNLNGPLLKIDQSD